MTTPGPGMRRRQLGLALQEVREQANLTMEALGAKLDLSRSAIGAFEVGRNLPSQPVLETILRECGALEQFDLLNEMRKDAKKPGWWSTYRLPQWLKTYVGYESDALRAKVFSLEIVPGLLQTEDYARALNSLHPVSDEEIERHVAARVQRQQRLTSPHPLTLAAVISEGALHRLFAQPEMAAAQLRQLVSSAQLPTVSLRVLPFSAGLHHSMSGSFTVLEFAPGVSAPIAYQDYAVATHLVDDQDVVRELSEVYDQLQAQALDESRSLDMISGLMAR
ncbi:MAG: helix-turn-helix transcriptional regulator [Pseudonocardiaceae bacterium]